MEGISIIITVAVSLFCWLVEIPTSDYEKEPNFFQRLDRSLMDDEENADSQECSKSEENKKRVAKMRLAEGNNNEQLE